VELGLRIASVTYGGLLGTFFLGRLFRKVNQADAIAGFLAGLVVMVYVVFWTRIDFTWHTLIGCAVTILTGNASRIYRSFRRLGSPPCDREPLP
jgi:Na+/proline symporter